MVTHPNPVPKHVASFAIIVLAAFLALSSDPSTMSIAFFPSSLTNTVLCNEEPEQVLNYDIHVQVFEAGPGVDYTPASDVTVVAFVTFVEVVESPDSDPPYERICTYNSRTFPKLQTETNASGNCQISVPSEIVWDQFYDVLSIRVYVTKPGLLDASDGITITYDNASQTSAYFEFYLNPAEWTTAD